MSGIKSISGLIGDELGELDSYVCSRRQAILKFRDVLYADDVIGVINELAGDRHWLSAWLGDGKIFVSVGRLNSFGEVGEYLRAIKRVVPQIMIEDRNQQDLSYECRVGVFKFTFTVSGENATCRKVQVGTKTVEEPIYEIQCDGKTVVDEEE